MTRAGAMSRAQALGRELAALGVPYSIEIMQGRPGTPNGRWFDTRFVGSMGHHIVSRRSQGNTPGLALVKRGRPDVPGPLCNGYLGFDGRARIICMGWANHPGAGGSITLPGGTIPRDGARPYLFGWEIEGGLVESDWTPAFRVLMGKVHAATLNWISRDERSHIEHKTWTNRKIDRLNYSLTGARNELKPHLKGNAPAPDPIPEDDMPYRDWPAADKNALLADLRKEVIAALHAPSAGIVAKNGVKWSLRYTLEWLQRSLPSARDISDDVWYQNKNPEAGASHGRLLRLLFNRSGAGASAALSAAKDDKD